MGESMITSFDGTKLYLKKETAADNKAVIVIVHGLCEHQGRYDYFAEIGKNRHEYLFMKIKPALESWAQCRLICFILTLYDTYIIPSCSNDLALSNHNLHRFPMFSGVRSSSFKRAALRIACKTCFPPS